MADVDSDDTGKSDGENEIQRTDEPVVIELPPAAPETQVTVDKKLFFQMVNACVVGHPQAYLGVGGMMRVGKMMGFESYAEAEANWGRIKEYLTKESW